MKKRFWANLGINPETLATMPERQVTLLDQIMSIEEQHSNQETQRNTKK